MHSNPDPEMDAQERSENQHEILVAKDPSTKARRKREDRQAGQEDIRLFMAMMGIWTPKAQPAPEQAARWEAASQANRGRQP